MMHARNRHAFRGLGLSLYDFDDNRGLWVA